MRGHTGGDISTERILFTVNSFKQKLNTCSSTLNEILAVDNCMPAVLQTRYWLDVQLYDVFEKILYQCNKSAILLENNSKD